MTRFGILCLAALCAPVIASGQITGSKIGKRAGPKDGDAIMRQIAGCTIERDARAVGELLATAPTSPKSMQIMQKLGPQLEFCTNEDPFLEVKGLRVKMTSTALRRAFASRLLTLRYPALPDTLAADDVGLRWFGGEIAPETYQTNEALTMLQLARCTIARDWRGVRALLEAKPSSDGERRAMRALAPTLRPCVPHDFSMTLTAATMRPLLAEATYYTLTSASVAGIAPRQHQEAAE